MVTMTMGAVEEEATEAVGVEGEETTDGEAVVEAGEDGEEEGEILEATETVGVTGTSADLGEAINTEVAEGVEVAVSDHLQV